MPRHRTTLVLLLAIGLAPPALIPATGCTQPPGVASGAKPPATGRPALHAVRSTQLHQIMEEINRLAAQRLPQELDTTFARSARSRELADLADHLADDARAIPDVLHDVRIPPDEARTFTDYAGRLEAQARELANLVRRGEHDRAAPKLAEITTTCNACHASFRILPLVQARE